MAAIHILEMIIGITQYSTTEFYDLCVKSVLFGDAESISGVKK